MDDVAPSAGGGAARPSLVMPTEELRRLLAARGEYPGFDPDDWEFSRNDARLGVPPAGEASSLPYAGYSIIEYYDRISVYGDHPRTYSDRIIRSGQIPR